MEEKKKWEKDLEKLLKRFDKQMEQMESNLNSIRVDVDYINANVRSIKYYLDRM